MKYPVDLSLIIVTYNSETLIEACLQSVFTQVNAPQCEVLVFDNASVDNTCAIVGEQFPQVQLFSESSNLGFGNANNQALLKAQGEYIVLLNPDAQLQENALQLAFQHMRDHVDVGIGGGLIQDDQGQWQPSARLFPSILNEFLTLTGLAARFPRSRFFGRFDHTWSNPSVPLCVDWVPGAFMIMPKTLLDEIGFFDPRYFLYYEEVDLCKRTKKAGYQVFYWPDVIIKHIGGASSETVDSLDFASSGKQLTLWRMRSQLLYYRKWHGLVITSIVKMVDQYWHKLRMLKNRSSSPEKMADSQRITELWQHAWMDTEGGKKSPAQPW